MVRRIRSGNARGYTLIELIIVIAIISILIAVAVPLYTKSIQRTKESVLKQNLFNIRTVIDEDTEDTLSAVDQTQPGISNVHSGSSLRSLEGNAYSEW